MKPEVMETIWETNMEEEMLPNPPDPPDPQIKKETSTRPGTKVRKLTEFFDILEGVL